MDFLVAIPDGERHALKRRKSSCRTARGSGSNGNDHTRRLGIMGGIVSAHPHWPAPRTICPFEETQAAVDCCSELKLRL